MTDVSHFRRSARLRDLSVGLGRQGAERETYSMVRLEKNSMVRLYLPCKVNSYAS